jgi:hypothetical protein
MPMNPLISNNLIDSCAFDPKYNPEDSASERIFKLYQEEKLDIIIAHSTQKEIDHPNTPTWVKQEAQKMISTVDVSLGANERKTLRKIEVILAGNGKLENILQDARHVFEAQKYGSYFITTDSRILCRSAELQPAGLIPILKPSEFLSLVKEYLRKEDNPSNDDFNT